jgi:Spy/CpxP family protein refolding chaperone
VAKSADATDLKSVFPQGECGFNSRPGHHSNVAGIALRAYERLRPLLLLPRPINQEKGKMNSRITAITIITAALSVSALMANPVATQQHRAEHGQRFDRISSALNLTDQQKEQARNIFKTEREATRPVRQELREERHAVQTAIQAGKPEAEVEGLAKNEGPVLAKLAAARADASAKFYAVLTPEQRQKLATMHQGGRRNHQRRNPNA